MSLKWLSLSYGCQTPSARHMGWVRVQLCQQKVMNQHTHSHLSAKYHPDLPEGTLYFLTLDTVPQPLKAVQTSAGLPTLSIIGTSPRLGIFFFLSYLPIYFRLLQHLSSLHTGPVLATADLVAHRLNVLQFPKRLFKANTTETGIFRNELMVLTCSQRASWWQLSLKTTL